MTSSWCSRSCALWLAVLGAGCNMALATNINYRSPFASQSALAVDSTAAVVADSCGSGALPSFIHGVASGDPFPDSVVLWTRITGDNATSTAYNVTYTVASDKDFANVTATGSVMTDAAVDWTVKVIPEGLASGSYHWYKFSACGGAVVSDIGRTKTAPAEDEAVAKVTFATVSCAYYSFAYFQPYRFIAEKANSLDAVLAIGDYIYEYGNVSPEAAAGDWFNEEQSREPIGQSMMPFNETVTLHDYRLRYALYHTDPDLQLLHKSLPWIVIPDDHEAADDTFEHGAVNHNKGEGNFTVRQASALRAWFEWIPARQFEANEQRTYRRFNWGNLVDLNMLDTRFNDRMKQGKCNNLIHNAS